MIKSRFASPLALAALLAIPAFAQTTTQSDVSSGTTTAKGAYVAPLEKNSAKQQAQADPKTQAKADSTATPSMGAQADVSTGTTTASGATVAPLEKNSAKQAAAQPAKQAKADSTTKSTSSAQADVSCGTTTASGAHVAPLEKNSAKQQAAADGTASQPMVAADCVTPKATKTAKKKSTKTAARQ